jgi:small subunit ribosomal protein S4
MKKMSDYGVQLREKQKLKRMYMLLEKQFKILFNKAERMKGITGENLISLLESRIDNIVYRLHFASSRSQARQLVNHGHIKVNGRRVTIPSYLVRENDVIEVQEASKKLVNIKESLKQFSRSGVSPWLELNPDEMKGKVLALPRRSDVTELADVKEHLIVELYSR